MEQLITRLNQAMHEKANPSSFLQIMNDFKKELGERNPIVLMVQITLE